MQVYVPLNTPASYAQTKPFARGIAQVLERRHPGLVVSDMKKSLRTGKVLVDWSQNDEHKTTVNVYSLRARERPTVSTPLRWEEVEGVLASGDPEELAFTSDQRARPRRRARGPVPPGDRARAGAAGSFLRVLNIPDRY